MAYINICFQVVCFVLVNAYNNIKFLPLSVNIWEVWKEAADSWEKDAVAM